MRIGYDVRMLAGSDRPSGIGRYALSLISAMRQFGIVELFSDRPWSVPPELSDLRLNVLPPTPSWQQSRLPFALRTRHIDVFHGLSFTIPIWAPCKTVVTIHDLGYVRATSTVAPDVRRYLSHLAPQAIAKSSAIIVPSEAVREDLSRAYPRHARKARVVPHGVDNMFLQHDHTESQEEIRQTLGEDRPYILAVGTHEPRKNLARLVEAFRELADVLPHRLIVVGAANNETHIIRDKVEPDLGSRVRLLGYLPNHELVRYYKGADAFVYPSLFEGFGLPLLEAMASGCPIATSERPCMPEVAGEAAVYFNPLNRSDMRDQIHRLLTHPELREDLRQKGFLRVQGYTWEATASRTYHAYEEALRA